MAAMGLMVGRATSGLSLSRSDHWIAAVRRIGQARNYRIRSRPPGTVAWL